jgi:hypothetical protein
LVVLSPTFSFLSHQGQRAQLVVPLGLERVGNETIARIYQHEAALREIGFDLRTLDGTTP